LYKSRDNKRLNKIPKADEIVKRFFKIAQILPLKFLILPLICVFGIFGSWNSQAADTQTKPIIHNTQFSSELVKKVQRALFDDGYNPGKVDGIWGRMTLTAMNQFQEDNGLRATNNLNKKTLDLLFLE